MRGGARVALILCGAAVLSTSGCGGCQSDTPPPPAAEPTAQRPAEPAAPSAAQAPAAPAAAEPDCFVIVDAEPDFGGAPLSVQFETEVDCTGSPVSYTWDFGDGEKGGNEAHPKHVYGKPGDYVATVRVSAPDGGSNDDEIDITVDELFDE